MRVLIWAQLFLCAGSYLGASAQTFNTRFDLFSEGGSQFGWGVEVDSTGSYIVFFAGGYIQDSVQYGSALSTVTCSPEGVFGNGFRLHIPWHNSYVGWANCAAPRTEGGYIVGSSTSVAGDTIRAALFWVEPDGTITNYRELELPGLEWIGRQAKQTPDGGFLLCGETSTVGIIDAFLLKTDANGTLEWVRTYGSPNKRDYFFSVDLAPWGGYYVGGTREIGPNDYDPWILGLDVLGNVIWQGDYGTPQNDYPPAHLTTASNGNVRMAATLNFGVGQTTQRACLLELDPNGAVVWQRLYGPQRHSAMFVVQEIEPSGDLISAGFSNVIVNYKGVLLRTTSTGDSLWMRDYQYNDALVEQGRGGLYDVQPTPDGGFIAVGVALTVNGIYSQDVWVIKTDSMGCLEPGCDVITGMETQLTNFKDALRVYPNPVLAGGAVRVELQLPVGFKADGPLQLTVTNGLGQLVHRQQLAGVSSAPLLWRWAGGEAGLYHLHLHDNTRWIAGAKLVVE